jgi:hypothetical protein
MDKMTTTRAGLAILIFVLVPAAMGLIFTGILRQDVNNVSSR